MNTIALFIGYTMLIAATCSLLFVIVMTFAAWLDQQWRNQRKLSQSQCQRESSRPGIQFTTEQRLSARVWPGVLHDSLKQAIEQELPATTYQRILEARDEILLNWPDRAIAEQAREILDAK